MIKKLLLISCIVFFALNVNAQPNNQTTQPTVLKSVETNDKEELDEEALHIEQNNKLLQEVINKINNQEYLKELDENIYKEALQFLHIKINANKKRNNTIAIARDQLKIIFLKEKREYLRTLTHIINGKNEFKDHQYFQNLLKNNITYLQNDKITDYKALYDQAKVNPTGVSKELIQNYQEAIEQNETQSFILDYLLNNISKYRKTNFFIDEFNLQYLVNQIDSVPGISFISNLTSYYLKFSIGEVLVVVIILLIFRAFNRKIITLLTRLIQKIYFKEEDNSKANIAQDLKEAIGAPLIWALYILAIQICIFILVKDPETINAIVPWINTTYIALFTWAIYAGLNNSINIYAHTLLDKYPNVRKEMIVFILRILKLVLILIVLLFLFTQLGIDIKAIAASLGVGGIAIALASKDTLANFFGSLNIMTDNSFSQGDWIKTERFEGTVVDIRMRTTRIRTFDNALITVPNSELANAHIKNWSKRKVGRRIKMRIGITYESNMQDVVNLKQDIKDMLLAHPDIASTKQTEPIRHKKFEAIKEEDLKGIKKTLLVYIDEFDASSINILVYCFSKSPNWEKWLMTKEDVLIQIASLVEKNNCAFAYPTQTLVVRKDEEVFSMEDKIQNKITHIT